MTEVKAKVKTLFQEEPLEDRAQFLEDNCKEMTTMPIRHEFTEKELNQKKERQIKLAIDLDVEDTKLAEIKADHKERTKQPRAEQKELIADLRKGFMDEEMQVYVMDNQEEGVMEYYNSAGECVYERPMHPGERQTNIHTIPKTGTNDE